MSDVYLATTTPRGEFSTDHEFDNEADARACVEAAGAGSVLHYSAREDGTLFTTHSLTKYARRTWSSVPLA